MIDLSGSVVIRRSRADEPEPGAHLEQQFPHFRTVVLMLHLDTVELMLADELLQHLRGEHLPASA